jgi:hypothetical protein
MKIYTVVILDRGTMELSTVSFKNPDDAVSCVMDEMEMAHEPDFIDDPQAVETDLNSQMFYQGTKCTYWIEEANLF